MMAKQGQKRMKDKTFKVKYSRTDKGALMVFLYHNGTLLADIIVCDDDSIQLHAAKPPAKIMVTYPPMEAKKNN